MRGMAEKEEYGPMVEDVIALYSDKRGTIDIVPLTEHEILETGFAAKLFALGEVVCYLSEEQLERLQTRAPVKIQLVLQEFHKRYQKLHKWKKQAG